jgi:anti-anti-sigma factor
MTPGERTVKIHSEQYPQALVVSLSGSFDALTADQARKAIGTQIDAGQRQIVLDLSRVDFMSSAGVRVLLEMLKGARRVGGDLRLAAAQSGIQRTLEISGLVRVLKTYPSVEEGLRSYEVQEPPASGSNGSQPRQVGTE